MPLPTSDPKAAWPPRDFEAIFARMRQWSAWYTGDLQKLQAAYGGGDIQDSTGFFASDRGGFRATVGRTLQRFFVGEPTRGPDRNTKVPIPIAAEICQASADLLFADPITVTVGPQPKAGPRGVKPGARPAVTTANPTQERVKTLLDDRFHSTLAEAAEIAAALGGAYLRATVDPKTVPDRPFTTVVDADNALPEFRHGRLTAVTFWWVVRTDGETVWRHLERHELNSFGVGIVLHGLYQGKQDTLGTRVSLTTIGDAALNNLALNTDVNGVEGTWDTKSPGLAVQYLPNQRPHRLWRDHPTGRYLGRSDLDGVEHLLDQLAEVMSAWTRAIRLAKARIFIAKSLIKNAGPGNGMVANLEQEAYTSVESLGGKDQTLAQQIQFVQPTVAYEQYQATARELIEQILQLAGYSTQTFGVDSGTGRASGMRTATEVESKERRSFLTRDRKIRELKPVIGAHVEKLLLLDNTFYGGSNTVADIEVVFPDSVQQTQLALAQTALALFQAEAASIEERVTVVHPEWDDEAVQEEADRIRSEFQPPPLMDPTFPMGGGPDGDPTAGRGTSTAV